EGAAPTVKGDPVRDPVRSVDQRRVEAPHAVIVLALEASPVVYTVASSAAEEARLGDWLEALEDAEVLAALELPRQALGARPQSFVPADFGLPSARRRWAA